MSLAKTVGMIVLIAAVASLVIAYPDYRKMKNIKNEYNSNSSCIQPIFSMGFRKSNGDAECKKLEDEYITYRHTCMAAIRNGSMFEKLRCMLIEGFDQMNLPAL